MSSFVSESVRDATMKEILSDPQNRQCFDCGSKEPKWASPYLGILVCYECAARHRSYGTHISFIRSIDLDKWKKNQIVSMKLAGNAYAKERFIQLGIQQIGGLFDYQSDLIQKYRGELSERVQLEMEKEIPMNENKSKEEQNKTKEENKEIIKSSVEEEKPNIEEETKKEEIKEPTKFEIKQSAKVKGIKVEGKAGKKNKIKKVDFDFDFDSFNDVNFSSFNTDDKKEEEKPKDEFIYSQDKEKEEEEREREKDEEKGSGYNRGYNFKVSKEEMNQKFKNKKAISSEDYAAMEEGDANERYISHKLKSMGNSQAISSSDIYGNNENDIYEESYGDKLKDFAVNFTMAAAEKAKQIKNKTNEVINNIQNKFNTGY
ncbi:MAG: hypothetical protein MJ252_27075 [archaeon]|nr:hypothetical protein [archaeon]